MIEVNYNREKCEITVKGHAYSNEAGHDLICSAASILVSTLAANVAELNRLGKIKGNPKIKLDKGDSEIKCKPFSQYTDSVKFMYGNLVAGFDLLAQSYPNNVKLSFR